MNTTAFVRLIVSAGGTALAVMLSLANGRTPLGRFAGAMWGATGVAFLALAINVQPILVAGIPIVGLILGVAMFATAAWLYKAFH